MQPTGACGRRVFAHTGPAALTYHQVASLLSAELGRPIDYQPIGLLRFRRELLAAGFTRPYVNVQLAINVVAAVGRAGTVIPDVERLLRRPAIPLSRFVADYAHVWRH